MNVHVDEAGNHEFSIRVEPSSTGGRVDRTGGTDFQYDAVLDQDVAADKLIGVRAVPYRSAPAAELVPIPERRAGWGASESPFGGAC